MPRGKVQGVEADALSSFLASLEDIESAASGYGQLKECAVEMEDGGKVVRAVYDNFSWIIDIEEGT